MIEKYVIVPCEITLMSGTFLIKGEIKWISEAYLICSEYNNKHNSQIFTKVNVLHILTVSVCTALQFLYNEYLIGGKDNMIKVDVSVYCRLLRRPEKLERNIN